MFCGRKVCLPVLQNVSSFVSLRSRSLCNYISYSSFNGTAKYEIMVTNQHQNIGFHSDTKWPEGPENGAIPFESEGPFTDVDKEIIKRHAIACKKRKSTYTDPITGYTVFTEYHHRQRGSCCGNECRHCPYGHEKVPREQRRTKFNSVFYQ